MMEKQQYAMLAGRRVPVAVAVELVPAETYRSIVAERDAAERLLTEAERRIGELERELARLRCLPASLPV